MENMGISGKFWKGKKVLITGHTGFKGSWLSIWLQSLGAKLIGYSIGVPTVPSLFQVARVEEEMVSIIGDTRDLRHLEEVMVEHKPEIVIHLAAQPIVRLSYEDPVETYSSNIMGTVNVLEGVRRSQTVRVALIITSDKCYQNREWFWGYRENDPMGGHDPYSSSKGCAELITSAYVRSFFYEKQRDSNPVAVASTRAGNVIGGGDWARDRLVPDVMRAFINKQPVYIRYPDAIRPWQHVLEPLRGYLMLAERLWKYRQKFVGAWNFGPNDQNSKSVSWIVNFLKTLWGEGAYWETDSQHHPHEDTFLKLDSSKALSLLKWSPQLTVRRSLEWIVEWYKEYDNGVDIKQVTRKQISQYEELF